MFAHDCKRCVHYDRRLHDCEFFGRAYTQTDKAGNITAIMRPYDDCKLGRRDWYKEAKNESIDT